MTTWTILDEAHADLRAAVEALTDTDWTRPTPCSEWNVAQVVRHAAGDQLAYAAAITGEGGPVENPFTPNADRPDDVATLISHALAASGAALSQVAPDATNVPCPLPIPGLDARTVVAAAALDAAVHAWDIAVATDQKSPLTTGLAAQLRAVAGKVAEPLRHYGAYAPVVVGDSADAADELLRFLGRDPAAW
jgi:uncharacterized protein (TIGR03086 family)